jgi:hypothetical protein
VAFPDIGLKGGELIFSGDSGMGRAQAPAAIAAFTMFVLSAAIAITKRREGCCRQLVRLSPRAVSIRAARATRFRDYAFSDRVAFS